MADQTIQPQVIDLNPSAHEGATGAVDDLADWYDKQVPMWNLADDLMGGTTAMRAAGTKYLTKFELESIQAFTARMKATVLTNFSKDHFFTAMNIMFAEPIEIHDSKIPQDILDNVDNQGHDLQAFAQRMAAKLLLYGMHHVMVDMPPNPGAQTLADDRAMALRPYWVSIDARKVINAFADVRNNQTELTQFRMLDQRTKVSGFSQTVTQAIRVIRRDGQAVTFETWVKSDDGPYTLSTDLADAGTYAIDRIPVVTFQTFDNGFMLSPSIMIDIFHKNVEHWQSASDQRNILTVCRYPIHFQIGTAAAVTGLGPHAILHSEGNETPKQPVHFGYIELQGASIAAGERDLDRIIQEANTLSIRLQQTTKKAQQTATGDVLDYSLSSSPLHMVAQAIERGLNELLLMTARWLGIPDADAGKVKVSREFGVSANDTIRIAEIGSARRAGDLSLETYIAEMQNVGVLKTNIDVELEKERIQKENTSLFAAVAPPAAPKGPKEPPPPADATEPVETPPAAKQAA